MYETWWNMGTDMDDLHNLRRFVEAQAPVFTHVLAELRAGSKRSHWMWFVFPQIAGLGHSETARRFAISARAEAAAYLEHPILGPRLRERKVLTAPGIGGVLATALSPNGRVMFALTSVLPASGYPPYTLRLAAYATATGRTLRTFLTKRHQVESVPGELAADPSGRYLIVANFPLKDSPGNNPLVGVTLVNVASGRAHTIYLRQSNVPLDIAW